MNVFQKDFDALLNDVLTDWRNQFPEADISQGSLIFIKSACLASALWGLYKYQDWIAAQVFPDTADSANLEHHSWVRGLSRKVGETDAELLARLLDYIRRPPAGGNQYDYARWAKEIANVTGAWVYPLAQGNGTVDVVITANNAVTGSEIPSSHVVSGSTTAAFLQKLIDGTANFTNPASIVRIGDVVRDVALGISAIVTAVDSPTQLSLSSDLFTAVGRAYAIDSLCAQVKSYIDDVRPVTASVVRVLAPTVALQDVTMTVTGTGINPATIAAEIQALISAMNPGETLYRSRLISVAIHNGAINAVVTTPAMDVVAQPQELIRPGAIVVT
ncbi:MAG: baseplate J/gp47 family protein [Endomicrobiales bacterium]